MFEREADRRLHRARLAAHIVAVAFEVVGANAALGAQQFQRVGDLQLAFLVRLYHGYFVEDLGSEHIAAERGEAAGRVLFRGLFHEIFALVRAGIAEHFVAERRAAVQVNLIVGHRLAAYDRACSAVERVDELFGHRHVGVHEIVARREHERLAADEVARFQECVRHALGKLLHGEEESRAAVDAAERGEPLLVALTAQRLFQLALGREISDNLFLARRYDDAYLGDVAVYHLVHDVLKHGRIDDGQHFLGKRFRCGKKSRSLASAQYYPFLYHSFIPHVYAAYPRLYSLYASETI